MLRHLKITDLAIIDELEVEFGPGFSVLTGETGAGKSILLGAVQLLLGARAGADWVRRGAEQGSVEAIFDLPPGSAVPALLRGAGLPEADGELVVRRVIRRDGKNRAALNGALSPLRQVAEVCAMLVDISGQHEHQRLLRSESHLEILDAFGRLGELCGQVGVQHGALLQIRGEREALDLSERERAEREDFLRFQIGEIDGLRLEPDEEEALGRERSRLRHAEKLTHGTRGAVDALYEDAGAAAERLVDADRLIADLVAIDDRLGEFHEAIERARVEVEEAADGLRRYADGIEADPARLEEIESRLSVIQRLGRKHGVGARAILERRDQMAAELDGLARREERLGELAEYETAQAARLAEIAASLTAKRSAAARKLSRRVAAELSKLAMPAASFEARVAAASADDAGCVKVGERYVAANGADRVEFLFGPNPGEGKKPLLRIASGGELSRAMLAIKQALAAADPVATYVFDEVDAGIGGAVAEVVGQALVGVSAGHQVLCVTHLPQIASLAARHYRVTKEAVQGRTRSSIEPLVNDAARVEELARMLGGIEVTQRTLEHAKEMLSYRKDSKKG